MSILSTLSRLKLELELLRVKSKVRIFLDSDAYFELDKELSEIQRLRAAGGENMSSIKLLDTFIIEHESVYANLVNGLAKKEEESRGIELILLNLIDKVTR